MGGATVFIEDNKSAFELLTYFGAAYIAYLGYKVATSPPLSIDEEGDERLGIFTGTTLQIVNGKAWIHFLVLMTAFGGLFGTGFSGKIALVVMNLFFGLPAVMSWAAFGSLLRRAFSTPSSAKNLNRVMGASLLAVAIWIAMPH
ncbi:LysE family transporter [Euryarchaeota archaeon]|nr:LysE family transporter [Euryarchaeota archaeon]